MSINLGFECLKNQISESSYNIADMLIDSTTICMHMESINDISKELDKSFEILNHRIEINAVLKKYNKDVAIESLFGKPQIKYASCEGISEIWNKIVEFFKMLFNKVKDFFTSSEKRAENKTKEVEALVAEAKKIKFDKSKLSDKKITVHGKFNDAIQKTLNNNYNISIKKIDKIESYIYNDKTNLDDLEEITTMVESYKDVVENERKCISEVMQEVTSLNLSEFIEEDFNYNVEEITLFTKDINNILNIRKELLKLLGKIKSCLSDLGNKVDAGIAIKYFQKYKEFVMLVIESNKRQEATLYLVIDDMQKIISEIVNAHKDSKAS